MKCKVFEIEYDPVLRTPIDNLECYIVSVNGLSDDEVAAAIDHPTGEIVIHGVFECTRDQMENSKNAKRVIFLDQFED